MNILFVIERFDLGGVERVTFQLLTSLKTSYPNIEFSVVYESAEGDYFKQYNDSFKCICLSGSNFFARSRSFKSILNRLAPNTVIYCKGGLSKYTIFTEKYEAIKHIAIQHVPIDLPETSWWKNNIRKLGAAILYRRMDKVICVSKGIEHNLISKLFLDKSKLTTIYNPVLDEGILEQSQENIEYSDFYVCVGRLHYQKGYDYLLKTVLLIVGKIPSFKVVIIGDGEDKALLEKEIVNLNLSDNVILHGSTSNPYKYIKNAKAIILPSRWEGLPTVLVEAAFLNTQIIAFDCRYGPKELTNNGTNGYLVEMGNIDLLSEAILMVDAGETKSLPLTGLFTLKSSVTNYVQLLESLLCLKN